VLARARTCASCLSYTWVALSCDCVRVYVRDGVCVFVRLIDGDRARETNKNILCAWDRERGTEQER